jgi:hypothetical protein
METEQELNLIDNTPDTTRSFSEMREALRAAVRFISRNGRKYFFDDKTNFSATQVSESLKDTIKALKCFEKIYENISKFNGGGK